jgi:hypothetical protein
MWLTVGNLNTKASNFASDEEERWLAEYLSIPDARARFIKGMRGDGRIHMYNRFSRAFPTGFAPMVCEGAAREGFAVEVVDRRQRPCEPDPKADLSWLRDYQRDAVGACLSKARGIVHAPTGAGKGTMIAGLAQALPCRWLFLVHRNTLVQQQAERIEAQAGVPCARVGEGRWEGFDGGKRVVCASFQTLHARLRSPEAAALLGAAEAPP